MATYDHDEENKNSTRAEGHQLAHNPHDKMFFGALRNQNIARDALRAYLPQELLSQLDLSRLTPYKTKLVSPQMKEFQADILYEIPFQTTTALVLFHCEQESQPKRTIPLKVWQYLFLVLMEYAENHPGKPLPIPFPLIVYTGEAEFRYSTNVFDLFGEHKNLAETYFLQGITLVDVCRLADEDIKKRTLFGLSEFAFKHKRDKNFQAFLETVIPWLHRVELQIGIDYAKLYIQYVIEVFPEGDYALFAKIAKQYLSEELEKEAMTIAQQLKHEGMQQGIQQGIQEGMQRGVQQGMQQGKVAEKREIAKNMLLIDTLSIETIALVTHLSADEVKAIKASMKH